MCGCGGFIEKGVLPAMADAENAQAVALFDVSDDRLQQVGDQFGIKKRFKKYDDLLVCDEVDVVYIASPNIFHREQVIAAAQAGKHVFCQKPMGMNARECQEMLAAVEAADVKMGLGFCFRYAGAQKKAKELLDAGEIGHPCTFHMSFNFHGYTSETVGWRCDAKLAGGGAMMDLAPHMVDLASFFMGSAVESVMSYIHPEKTKTEIETDALIILQMVNGTSALLDTSFNLRGDGAFYRIVGSSGEIRRSGIDGWRINGEVGVPLTVVKSGTEHGKVNYPAHEYIEKELVAFCRAVENGEEPPVSGQYGSKLQAVIDAVFESGKTGRRIEVEYSE
jgi:predicted dehydrogenase